MQGLHERRRSRAAVCLLAAAAGALPAATAAAPAGAEPNGPVQPVIVLHRPGAGAAAEHAVRGAGGSVTRALPIVDGIAAHVPSGSVARLRASTVVTSVTPDGKVLLLGSRDGATSGPSGGTAGSLATVTRTTGARAMWAAGFTGRGVDVAVIDSGTVPVEGLAGAGKVVRGPDLSFDSPSPALAHLDSFGHGTHMAGIIAGRDGAAATPTAYATDTSRFLGMAPDARLVDVKVADTEGAVDVSQVIAAIDWVVTHKRSRGLDIRVLNLSFGTDGTQSHLTDPLAAAAEAAWRNGIVVVASAGNAGDAKGRSARGLTDPATDPFVIAVGAADSNGTVSTGDDTVAPFSSAGATGRSGRIPDLVAPGRSIESTKSPGSLLDATFPDASVGTRFMRGSGSSQAAAVTSGAAALLLSRFPDATPDQVKAMLRSSAERLRGVPPRLQGEGLLDLRPLVRAPLPPVSAARQRWDAATGRGTLEGARGTGHVSFGGVELRGERDIRWDRFDSAAWATQAAQGRAWSNGSWLGNEWLTDGGWGTLVSPPAGGDGWSGVWTGNRWSGNRWSGNRWSGNRWSGNRWSGNRWSGNRWSVVGWAGDSWT